uniref:UCH domain-containing protein n=1 Tax=Macrostomum lignano TaxID=282301 RepID=A0A1I8JRV4_9PLAT
MQKRSASQQQPAGGGRCPHTSKPGWTWPRSAKTLRQLGGTADAQPCRPFVTAALRAGATGRALALPALRRHRLRPLHRLPTGAEALQNNSQSSGRSLCRWTSCRGLRATSATANCPPAAPASSPTACNLLRCHADRLAALPAAAAADGRRAVSAAAGRECRACRTWATPASSTPSCSASPTCPAWPICSHSTRGRRLWRADAAGRSRAAAAAPHPSQPDRTTKCLAASLAAIRSGQQAPHRPSDLLGQVMERNPRFRGRQQQDAHELLRDAAGRLQDRGGAGASRRPSWPAWDSARGSDPKQVPQELRAGSRLAASTTAPRDRTCLELGLACPVRQGVPYARDIPGPHAAHHRGDRPPPRPSARARSVVAFDFQSTASRTPRPEASAGEEPAPAAAHQKEQQKRAAKQQRQQQIEKGRLDEMEAEKKLESLTLEGRSWTPAPVENPDSADGSAGKRCGEACQLRMSGDVRRRVQRSRPACEESEMKEAVPEKPGSEWSRQIEGGGCMRKPAAEGYGDEWRRLSRTLSSDVGLRQHGGGESGTPERAAEPHGHAGGLPLADSSGNPRRQTNKARLKRLPVASLCGQSQLPPPGTLRSTRLFQFTAAELLTTLGKPGSALRSRLAAPPLITAMRLLIDQPPRLLTLQLKRFAQQGRQLAQVGQPHPLPPLPACASLSAQLFEHIRQPVPAVTTPPTCAPSPAAGTHISDSHVSPRLRGIRALKRGGLPAVLCQDCGPETSAGETVAPAESATSGVAR